MPSVLLSIVTWNSAAVIEQCLHSALTQTHPDFEVWVVDNASADDTCARVAAVAATDPRVQLHRLPRNTGFCGGHNYALDRTSSEAVLLVNPDVVMQTDYLALALQTLRADARVGTVCGLLLQSADANPRIDSTGMEALPDGRFRLRQHGQRLQDAVLTTGPVAGADGALPLYRRTFIDDLRVEGQFFDERFFAHKEDWDIAWRGRLFGWLTVFNPACRAVHPREFRPADLRRRLQLGGNIKADAVKNQWLLLLKNPPRRELPTTLLRALPRQLGILLYCLLLERPSLRAYRYVWQHWGSIRQARRLIQSRIQQREQGQVPLASDAPAPKVSQPTLATSLP
ncbi:glycosyltransferase family 2 protein [Hymenobacter persicinus]|uniref:Glycosyltransferase family 2 protein n=1 Tax=Hymenobacter persicinus TaxID=2025506 RepID=A0A4Q5L8D6_9BACT|nr:glycosyltransferase family 2 protein [Hymenobacter persicinus]RYU74629.1 glycosyltransferase family 2 protein [Hymenobacter persicinus]